MSTRTEAVEGDAYGPLYRDAALAGVTAGVVFGLLIQFGLGRMTTIGALVTLGEGNLAVGWATHLVNSSVFAMVYALGTRVEPFRTHAGVSASGAAMGAAYGFALWFVNIGFIWPVWLNAVGVSSLPVPNLGAIGPLGGHLVWGLLMGTLFAGMRKRR
jgi:hypothetical protein